MKNNKSRLSLLICYFLIFCVKNVKNIMEWIKLVISDNVSQLENVIALMVFGAAETLLRGTELWANGSGTGEKEGVLLLQNFARCTLIFAEADYMGKYSAISRFLGLPHSYTDKWHIRPWQKQELL